MERLKHFKPVKLTEKYYNQSDVVKIAKSLIGKVIVRNLNNTAMYCLITETEAYAAFNDKASHAYNGKLTERNKTMYCKGGTAYVYICYGLHYLFNIVTNIQGIADAVLIRGVKLFDYNRANNSLTFSAENIVGPGRITKKLSIDLSFNNIDLTNNELLYIEDWGIDIHNNMIISDVRIGVDYAGNDAKLPYRFLMPNNIKLLNINS